MTNPPWLDAARYYLGLAEIAGPGTHPTIRKWLTRLKAWWSDDETPWCGTFVSAAFLDVGITPVKHWYRAKAWLEWGTPLNDPVPGCVVVFERKGGGHVGFVVGEDLTGRLLVLGGNQGNRVSIAPFDRSRVLGYRWPPGHIYAPFQRLERFANSEKASRNEA